MLSKGKAATSPWCSRLGFDSGQAHIDPSACYICVGSLQCNLNTIQLRLFLQALRYTELIHCKQYPHHLTFDQLINNELVYSWWPSLLGPAWIHLGMMQWAIWTAGETPHFLICWLRFLDCILKKWQTACGLWRFSKVESGKHPSTINREIYQHICLRFYFCLKSPLGCANYLLSRIRPGSERGG